MGGGSAASSSGEEDGDADWRAAIESASGFSLPSSNGPVKPAAAAGDWAADGPPTPGLKLYQIKAKKMLEGFLDKNLEIVSTPGPHTDEATDTNGGGVKLFRKAPPGITLDALDKYIGPQKKPRILPGEEINEKSKKFKIQLRSVAVDGIDVIASAREKCERSLARFEAKDAVAKAAAKREEERVLELKKIRGQQWLPSMARET